MSLGNYPSTKLADARLKYNEAYSLVIKGVDPQAANTKAPILVQATLPAVHVSAPELSTTPLVTFGHFADKFLKWVKPRFSDSWYTTNRLALNKDILPYWEARPISDIRRRDAIELLERVANRSPGQAANVHKTARAVFEYALQREYVDNNPLVKLTKAIPELKQEARQRVLSETEMRFLWKAIEEGPGADETKRALKFILITAQRPGEVAGMHSMEIEGEWWKIPKERAEKGKGDHLVYLSPLAREIVGQKKGFIFPTPWQGNKGEERPIGRNALAQLVSTEKYYGLPRWTPHDLRRTARTGLSRLKVPREHAEAVLNHCKQGVVKVYDLYEYQEEKKAALLKWGKELTRILKR